jgi:hypothetical protein
MMIIRNVAAGFVLAAALAACSPANDSGGIGGAPNTSTTAQTVNAGSGHDACHGDITNVDVAPLLGRGPLVASVDASNPAKCSFMAANNTAVQITLARGADVQTTWDRVSRDHGGAMIVVIGAGDAAQRTADNSVLMARKGALLCQMSVVGPMDVIVAQSSVHDADGVNATMAALCAKVFDAEHA